MRFRFRLTLYAATVTFLSVFGFIVLLSLLGSASSTTDHETTLSNAVDATLAEYSTIDQSLLAGVSTPFIVDSPNSVDAFIVVADDVGVVSFSTGLVFRETPTVPAAVVLETLEQGSSIAVADVGGVEMRMAARPWPESWGADGVIVVMQPTEFAQQQLRGLAAVLWIAGIITIIATTVIGWLVSGRAVRPLTDLAETTDAIAETGDLSQRLPAEKHNDEVGRLTKSFNGMLASLEDARGRLAASLDTQRQFVADASHELRSPLTTVRSNAGFLLDRPDASEDDRSEAIRDISTEADRMTLLVDDLLMLARGDEGLGLAQRPVDLAVLAADVGRRAERLGHDVTVEAMPATVIGDEPTLDRLMWILVDNAAKHGGEPIRLEVHAGEGRAAIRVIDSGSGFPDGTADKAFDRFFRADPARSPSGSGLGLAIAKWVTEAHGGTISATNRPSGGGIVTAQLPSA